jgi:hypothetical protein
LEDECSVFNLLLELNQFEALVSNCRECWGVLGNEKNYGEDALDVGYMKK